MWCRFAKLKLADTALTTGDEGQRNKEREIKGKNIK